MAAQFHHSNIDFSDKAEVLIRKIFVTPRFHAGHHTVSQRTGNANYSTIFIFWDRLFRTYGEPDAEELKDPKTRLQEWLQSQGRQLPEYKLARAEGAEHAKRFFVVCRLPDSAEEVEAQGDSRRKAEQAAARRMLELTQGERP